MTTAQFDKCWHDTYPEVIPLAHYFRHVYPDRWFRIHSLPDSQRYAYTEAEWAILLERQNTLLTDLLGDKSAVVVVSGEYQFEDMINTDLASDTLTALPFSLAKSVDLHKFDPANYETGSFYQPMFNVQTWQPNRFDELLKEIADDQTRAFFISWQNACIVAPYDGGVDVLLKDSPTRDYYREKYKSWLSPYASGT